tara:strand:- start:585 stop:1664 length:1080 start_codon:yes stop_codon:yes gene_type:complete
MREFLIAEEAHLAVPDATYGTTPDTKLAIQILNKSTGLAENVFGGAGDLGALLAASGNGNAQMRFAQGKGTTAQPDVFTPWVRIGSAISYDGLAYNAPTASHTELDIAGDCTAAGVLDLKFVFDNPQDGLDQFWHLSVDITAVTDDNIDALIKTAYDDATKPEWLFSKAILSGGSVGTDSPAAANGGAVSSASDVIRFHGNIPGSTDTSSGKEWAGDSSNIRVIVTGNTATGPVFSEINKVAGDNGIGSYYSVKKIEDKQMGQNYGYYNRRNLPNTPANAALSTSTYNFINLVFSKDGTTNSTGMIRGVDNIIEITLALKVGGTSLFGGGYGDMETEFILNILMNSNLTGNNLGSVDLS